VDVDRVIKEARAWDNVVRARKERYACSKPSVARIKDFIKRHDLNRIVIASCTPRMHRKMFERNIAEMGLNPAFSEIVNIREQCSWVTPDNPEEATLKALDLLRGSVKKIEKSIPLEPGKMEVNESVLIIGGGIAGITAALRTSEYGLKTYLIEKKPTIGGHMIQYPKVFPTLDCSQCILTPKMGEVADNPNIELLTLSEVKNVSGVPGDFKVTVSQKPRGVNLEECIACAACNRVCPVEGPNKHNEGLGTQKAVFLPFPQAVPTVYSIDFELCNKCGECVESCPRDAINLDDEEKEVELNVGTIILATGFEFWDISDLGEFWYGKHPNILNAIQMERLMDVTGPTQSSIVRLSDGEPVKKIAYVLCAGSRDAAKGVPYCSRVCCLYALKQSLYLKKYMEIEDISIHYIDIRAPGRRYEEFYKHAQEEGTRFVKGKVSEIIPDGDQLIVRAEDMLVNRLLEDKVDLVVLCPPVSTSSDTLKLSEILKTPVDEDKFILERHPKLDPIATKREGVFACGMVNGPKDIQTTVSESEGAAIKAVNFLKTAGEIEPKKAYVDIDKCIGSGECIKICPVDAINLEDKKANINQISCIGCGACIPACPAEAIDLQGLTEDQLLAQIKGILDGSEAQPKVLAFTEVDTVYIACDIAGVSRLAYPSSIRIIPVPSTARIKLKHILYAFAYGADGVMLLEAPPEVGSLGRAHEIAEERSEIYMFDLEEYGIESQRLWFSKVYVPDWRKLESVFKTFDGIVTDEGPIDVETRKNLLDQLEKKD
jgi:heterodisulfide reductase subunit A